MPRALEAGQRGEKLAEYFLQDKGWRLLARNWRCKVGEIDLVMRDHETLVFVEVRLRAPTQYGQGLETVSVQKQAKLRRAAAFYQQQADDWGEARFDVISIEDAPGQPPRLEHITDAF